MAASTKVSFKKYMFTAALIKAAVTGAGLAIAALASIDFAIAVSAKEAWEALEVDSLFNKFALFGAAGGVVVQFCKAILFR